MFRRDFISRLLKSTAFGIFAGPAASVLESGCAPPAPPEANMLPGAEGPPTPTAPSLCATPGVPSLNVATDTNNVLTLCLNTYTNLQSNGGSYSMTATLANSSTRPIGVTRINATTVACVNLTCKHLGCIIANPFGNPNPNEFTCQCHGSQYSGTGALIAGPSAFPLDSYASTLGAQFIQITLS
jgi:cytochrome b6-f complex iron-sulfur subunit